MATQTYCTASDVKDVISDVGYDLTVDDNENGLIATAEDTYATNAIERAAANMNAYLGQRYVLSELASSDWCKWVNADWAAMLLFERRNNPAGALEAKVAGHREMLEQIRDGHARVPDVVSSLAKRPSVSNFGVDRSRCDTPTPVDVAASTGGNQNGNLKRRIL